MINDQYWVQEDGQIWSVNSSIMLKPRKAGRGYCQVNLGANQRNQYVHRLVAEAFIPNPENKPQINHINGIKSDNRVENLEWVTAKENVRHALEIGLADRHDSRKAHIGSKHHNTSLKESQVLKIRAKHKKGIHYKDLMREFNISKSCCQAIIHNRSWRHI
jgi:hypothetical protein